MRPRTVARPASILAVGLLLGGWIVATGSRASEAGFVAGPIGGSDIRQAIIPPPGGYFGLYGIGQQALDIVRQNGTALPSRPDGASLAAAIAFAHVFEPEVFGGHVIAGAAAVGGKACLRLASGLRGQCNAGFGDSYAEIGWGRYLGDFGLTNLTADDPRRRTIPYGLHIAAGVGTIITTGRYKTTDIIPLGLNTPVLLPSIAATYITPPLLFDGTEFSARVFYDIHGQNTATRYQTGDLVVLDWAVTERMGRYQVGVVGSYAKQVEPDELRSRRVASTTLTSLGGVLAIDIPETAMAVEVKGTTELGARYRLTVQALIIKLLMKVY